MTSHCSCKVASDKASFPTFIIDCTNSRKAGDEAKALLSIAHSRKVGYISFRSHSLKSQVSQ